MRSSSLAKERDRSEGAFRVRSGQPPWHHVDRLSKLEVGETWKKGNAGEIDVKASSTMLIIRAEVTSLSVSGHETDQVRTHSVKDLEDSLVDGSAVSKVKFSDMPQPRIVFVHPIVPYLGPLLGLQPDHDFPVLEPVFCIALLIMFTNFVEDPAVCVGFPHVPTDEGRRP